MSIFFIIKVFLLVDGIIPNWLRQMFANVSAMVSTGIKITEFPIKHLAKTFYFVLSFHF